MSATLIPVSAVECVPWMVSSLVVLRPVVGDGECRAGGAFGLDIYLMRLEAIFPGIKRDWNAQTETMHAE